MSDPILLRGCPTVRWPANTAITGQFAAGVGPFAAVFQQTHKIAFRAAELRGSGQLPSLWIISFELLLICARDEVEADHRLLSLRFRSKQQVLTHACGQRSSGSPAEVGIAAPVVDRLVGELNGKTL
jgi:hypothetical protein